MTSKPTCEGRIDSELGISLSDIKTLWKLYQKDPEGYDEDLGNFADYGLCFDYVEPGTFEGQQCGYWRYQLSWGGPSDEFRLYGGGQIEYRFHDWGDGAGRYLKGSDLEFMQEIFDWYLECQEDRHGF